MGRIGILITWSELTGSKPSNDLVHRHLARYSPRPILLRLARLSAKLAAWQNPQESTGELEAVRESLPNYYPAIKQLIAKNPDRVILTRITLLYVAKQALIICPLDGGDIVTPWDVEQIMTCCLMANDLLLGREPSRLDATIDKAASMLPFSNYLPDPDDTLHIGRNLLIMSDIVPELAQRRDYRNLALEFQTATGLSPQTFCEFVYCVATKFINNISIPDDSSGFVLTPDYFRQTRVRDGLREFIKQYSIDIASLQAIARGEDSLDVDFLLFQERPLLEFRPDNYMCIDPGFLLDKAGQSFYWTLHANSLRKNRKHLPAYWGTLVETYTQWIAERTYRGSGALTKNPRFPNNDEACDLMIKEGSQLVLIEIKASILTAKAKYGFDAAHLDNELRRKAMEGEGAGRKGIAQLRHTIERLQNGEFISGVSATQISKIYPVIVFLDRSFTSPFLGTLYRNHFDRRTLKGKPMSTGLCPMTLSDLENILPYTHEHDLTDIMDEHYRCNRTANGEIAYGPFADANIPLLRDTRPGTDVVRERFERFCNELEIHIF